jgi:aminoglycoside phosphotransferase (APT) family kinase protein
MTGVRVGEPPANPDLADLEAVIQTGVLDPAVLNRHLRGLRLCEPDDGVVSDVRIGPVMKHQAGKRCTFEIGLRTEDGWRVLVAKIHRKDRSDVFDVMTGIQQAGFSRQDDCSIPQPVAYVPSLHCLLQEKVDGTRADEVLKTGDEPDRALAAERCGRWLARFHALAPKTGPVSSAEDFLNSKSMRRYSAELARQNGTCALKAARLHRRLEEVMASLATVEMCAGHGSYSASHVLLARERTVVLDWDGYDVADPARDVARFLAASRRPALGRHGSIRALDGTAETFLEAYLAAGQPGVRDNLRFFEAASCLNLARHTLCRYLPCPTEKQAKAEAMLDEGFSVLDGGIVQ